MKLFPFVLALSLGIASQSAAAAPYQLVHAFTGGKGDGFTPTYEASLTASGSYFYGVTQDGGQFTNGVVFQINTNGSDIKILHAFNGWAVLNMSGSKADGALPSGTPVLGGSTLYGMTQQGGSNGFGWGLGTVYSVNTDGTGFQVLHNFGALNDGYVPQGSLVLSGSTLYGMTTEGGTNGISEGIIFSIGTNGSGYQILHSFISDGGAPKGSLIVWGATLYGMTAGEIFRISTDGTEFLPVHQFAGAPDDGSQGYGSPTRMGAYLYGMTSGGGANSVGTVFQLNLIGSHFLLLHSFALSEAYEPFGDLALSGSTLYGMTYGGVTNYEHIGSVGSGAVFQIETNGTGYQVMHTFEFPSPASDGSLPYGTPIVLGSKLYGMTSLGGSAPPPFASRNGGCIFSLTLTPSSSSAGDVAPSITTTSPLPNGKVGVAYSQELAASDGATPYAWTVSSGHLPSGVTLSASGLLSGKPTAGGLADFTIKVTGHDKLFSTQAFALTIEAPPKLTITTPKAAQKFTTPNLNVSGTASGSETLNGVFFQLNNGAWTKALTSDAFVAWNYPNLPLMADTNIFSAFAIDSFGNYSATDTVKFIYYVTTALTVKTNGSGAFTPPDNGKQLQVGATFPLTAKAGKGFAFLDWTDGLGNVLTKESTLKFVMASNLTLVANFVPVAKPALVHRSTRASVEPDVSGNYNGLFAPPEGGRQVNNSGAVRLMLAESGSFSGKVLLGPDAFPFSGNFDSSGTARILLAKKENNTTITLQLDPADQAVTGEVTGGAFVAKLKAYRNAFGSNNPAINYQGTYRVTVPGSNDPRTAQVSIETVTVDAMGTVTFAGTLANETAASQTSLVSRDGYWPLYVPLTGGRGSFWAWSQLTNGTVRSLPMSAAWITGTKETAVQVNGSVHDAANQQ